MTLHSLLDQLQFVLQKNPTLLPLVHLEEGKAIAVWNVYSVQNNIKQYVNKDNSERPKWL